MGFIQCPGCQGVFDTAALGSVVCETCERCLVCGTKGSKGRPQCPHRLTPTTVTELEESLGIPEDRVPFEKRLAAQRFSAIGYVVLILVFGSIGALLLVLIQFASDRLGTIVATLAQGLAFVAIIYVALERVPRLLARGWLPWMIRRRGPSKKA
jgi:hypothetical protein